VRRIAIRIVGIVLLAALSACSRTLHLPVPAGAPVRLVTFTFKSTGETDAERKEVLLQPDAAEYRRLQEWVAHNQSGWSQSFATPFGGIVVNCGDLHLQFIQTMVVAFTAKGEFQKDIREEDYAFLTTYEKNAD
jgi:hypothetical protein